MENINEHIDKLLLRYHKGEITDTEELELLSWVEKNDENRIYFKEQMAILKNIGPRNIQFDAQKGLEDFFRKTVPVKTYPLKYKWLAIAASLAFVMVLASVFFMDKPEKDIKFSNYYSKDSILSIALADHSEISLSKGSTLNAPKGFDDGLRKVALRGKAFFKIFRDESRPFIVSVGNIEVEVLGTSFEVESDSIDNTVTVSVAEGKVSVNHRCSHFSKTLTKNNQIRIDQQGKVIEELILENENQFAWKTGILIFNNSPMKVVSKDLSRLYAKVFIFEDEQIADYLLTTKIDKQSLEEVKLILEKTLDVGLKEQNDTIKLFKKQ